METIVDTNSPSQTDMIPLVQAALDEAPVYVEHICGILASCGQSLRAGDDLEGMKCLARGASDLDQFIQLFQHVSAVSRPASSQMTEAFKEGIARSVQILGDSMNRQDMISLSDEIEEHLIPLLSSWDGVSRELCAGIAEQRA